MSVDFPAITNRQQTGWAKGDFNQLARLIVPASESLVHAVDCLPDERVLDVACGTGNASLAASRRYCDVTGIDFVPALLDRARLRAEAEGSSINFRTGDAQALPFPDASFDVVLSVFGVMFAPDQERAAGELLRVCRPGGRIGLCCWTPEGFAGDLFRTVGRHIPPPKGLKPPARWGTRQGLEDLLGRGASAINVTTRVIVEHFRSIEHAVHVLTTDLGPISLALQNAAADKRKAIVDDIAASVGRFTPPRDGVAALEGEYLEIVVTRAGAA
jgi:SAM-dependent methyltransferase